MVPVTMPSALADLLVKERLAIRPGTRGHLSEIAVVGVTTLTTTISLLQGPDTFRRLTEIIRDTFGKSEGITVEIKAKDGNVTIEIPTDASVEAVARRIRETLVADED
ncbi:hypothetical protein ACIQ9J_36170 [Streptomyces sp. NPDC094153]|uniref:hypothetical protein n=1 Tax=Streptomyces sp. NPDC094153 TaxID=3366058 RepID=UPI00380B234C